jgi:RNA polymerase sigma factor (sigma-70 family)
MANIDFQSFAKRLGASPSQLLFDIRRATDLAYKRYSSNMGTEDDLFQEVMVVLLEKLKDPTFPADYLDYQEPLVVWGRTLFGFHFGLQPSRNITGWVYVVARNKLWARYRKLRRTSTLSNRSIQRLERTQQLRFLHVRKPSELEQLIEDDEMEVIVSHMGVAIAALPEKTRQVAYSRFFRGLTAREISSELSISPNRVLYLVRKIESELHEKLLSMPVRKTAKSAELEVSTGEERKVDVWITQRPPLSLRQSAVVWMQIGLNDSRSDVRKSMVRLSAYLYSSDATIQPRCQEIELWSDEETKPVSFLLTPTADGIIKVNLSLYVKANMLLVEERLISVPVLEASFRELVRQ